MTFEKHGNIGILRNLYCNEWWRLSTFSHCPRELLYSSILLAKHGFAYTGKGNSKEDTVVCVFCSCVVRIVDITIDISEFHRVLNPNCGFVQGLHCGNISIEDHNTRSFEDILSQARCFGGQRESSSALVSNGPGCGHQVVPLEVDERQVDVSGYAIASPSSPSTIPNQQHVDISNSENDNISTSADSVVSTSENNASNDTCHQTEDQGASSQFLASRAESLHLPGLQIDEFSSPIHSVGDTTYHTAAAAATFEDKGSEPGAGPVNVPSITASSIPSSSQNEEGISSQISNSGSSIPQHGHATANTTRGQGGMTVLSNSQVVSDGASSALAQTSSSNSTSQPGFPHDSDTVSRDKKSSYAKFGILTSRPKLPEFSIRGVRLDSFKRWPQGHHIKPEALAEAGFFYKGYSDCARCFYCGVGFRNWEIDDDVWVEHARWYPKCGFLVQSVGQTFIDVVQDMNKDKETITYYDVITEMKRQHLDNMIPKDIGGDQLEILRDFAVKTILDKGFKTDDVVMAAERLRERDQSLTSDLLYEELCMQNLPTSSRKDTNIKMPNAGNSKDSTGNESSIQQTKKTIEKKFRDQNDHLRQEIQCKICLERTVSVVFLPCGHFATCRHCAYALTACPICRQTIQGFVRGHFSSGLSESDNVG